MVEVGTSTGFWTLEFWGNITNLIGVVILGMAVPIGKWLIKKREDLASANRKKEDEHIAKICQEMTGPMMKKLEEITGDVNYLKGYIQKNFDSDSDSYGPGSSGGPDDIDGRPRGGGAGGQSRNRNRPGGDRGRRYVADTYANEDMDPSRQYGGADLR